MARKGLLVLLLAPVLVLSLVSCETVPYTGRKQFNLLSNEQEASLGLQAYQEVLADSKTSTNTAWVDMVRRCGQRIAAVADQPEFKWEFNVIASPTVNAFCLPGGKVAFYEGIMPVCQDETGVAVVMGHEVAHAIAHHGAERVSQSMVAQGITESAAALLGGQDPEKRELVLQGLGIGLQVGAILPFSRKHESEADHIGLILMAKAGYDPHAAVAFWKRMETMAGGSTTPEWLSTHPHSDTRIRQLEAWMPEAMPYYETARDRGR